MRIIYDYKYNVVARNPDKFQSTLVITTKWRIVALFFAALARLRYEKVEIL